MLRSMFSAVSGLRAHQTMMDVVSNNIANVNTAGFKASRSTFSESLAQVVRGATGVAPVDAGVNPMQVGLGTQAASIDTVFGQGAAQLTGRSLDVAIQGEGFFVLDVGGQQMYSRAGAFSLDRAGHITGPTGGVVQGWMADPATGVIDTNAPVEGLKLPSGQVIDPVVTSKVDVGGNLPSGAATGDVVSTSITVYDSLGNAQLLDVTFTKAALPGEWTMDVAYDDGLLGGTNGPHTVTFDTAGKLTSAPQLTLSGLTFPGAASQDIDIDLATDTPLVQFGGSVNAKAMRQDGNAIGVLREFAIGEDGRITGLFSNGESKELGQIAIAAFTNNGGLQRMGESMWAPSPNSGQALIGKPGEGTTGALSAGALEMSNVDLAQEFTNLIIAQRGFQANSRAITTSDEMLQELVNIKR